MELVDALFDGLRSLPIEQFLSDLLKIFLAFILTLPIAWDREQRGRTIGLRTFPLVAMASAGFILLALQVMGDNVEAQARIVQGLMTGVGFIGGGAILKSNGAVHGTAAAASIWSAGVIGGAAAYGRFDIALLIGVVNFLLLRTLTPLKERIRDGD